MLHLRYTCVTDVTSTGNTVSKFTRTAESLGAIAGPRERVAHKALHVMYLARKEGRRDGRRDGRNRRRMPHTARTTPATRDQSIVTPSPVPS
jgi:hypothetical protein